MSNNTDGRIKMAFGAMMTSLVCTVLSIIPIVSQRVFFSCLGMFAFSSVMFIFLIFKLGNKK